MYWSGVGAIDDELHGRCGDWVLIVKTKLESKLLPLLRERTYVGCSGDSHWRRKEKMGAGPAHLIDRFSEDLHRKKPCRKIVRTQELDSCDKRSNVVRYRVP